MVCVCCETAYGSIIDMKKTCHLQWRDSFLFVWGFFDTSACISMIVCYSGKGMGVMKPTGSLVSQSGSDERVAEFKNQLLPANLLWQQGGSARLKRNWGVLCRPFETNRLWSHGYPFISHWPCNCWDAHHWLRRSMDWSQFQHCLFLMCSGTVVRAKLICLWLKLSGGTTYLVQNQD